jgi:moderate conductance mechanosensitive channel
MSSDQMLGNAKDILNDVVGSIINVETLVIFAVALSLAYIVNRLLFYGILKIARYISHAGDTARTSENRLRYRRLETYMSVALALIRFAVYVVALIVAWEFTHPNSAPAAIVASSTIFIVLAGATIVPMLRDLTTGSIMIAEKWYNVGDFITIEPFGLSGVVERMNLRSTKIRSLSGEIIWIHNQNIQSVQLTPRGVRTLAIDIFVNNLEKGKKIVEEVASTLPVETTMLAAPLKIVETNKLGDKLWQITSIGEVTPGREWLLQEFARESMEESSKKDGKVIIHGPIVYHADAAAERRFSRARILNSDVSTQKKKKAK